MNRFEKVNRITAIAIFGITLLIYLKTVAPSVSFWDCGEFITTSYILGIPHPPGAPLYTLLGRIFSIIPFGEIAFRVNLLSVFSGTISAVLIYLCVIRLLTSWLDPRIPTDRMAILSGGVVASLSTAFSTSFWGNAAEAEVYGLSMCITLLAVWLALRWDDSFKDHHSDRILLFIVYIFGLGAGVHLQCLLTIPGILILVFTDLMKDHPARTQYIAVTGLIFYPFLAILLPLTLTVLMTLTILIAMIVLRKAWRNPLFWIYGLILGGLGFSTYFALWIRSGLNPVIDMNNPETWENFKAFLARQQYGTHALFPRRGEFWTYQINIHIKYFFQQFPFYDNFSGNFRRAVSVYGSQASETINYSLIPLLCGFGGAVYHLRQDWKRFFSLFSMFALMSIGLVLYLNMPDPEPREREYIFVGAYTFFGFWIGIGAAGLVAAAARTFTSIPIVGLVAFLTLLLPAGILNQNHFSHNRTGDLIPYDYAYNILQTCEPNAILFTNGDNDTYPLWFLQEVEGVRTDIRVVNLSLIKTSWYNKQLRDGNPSVPINLSDEWIDQNLFAQRWDEPESMKIAGIEIPAKDVPNADYFLEGTSRKIPVIETHTWMIWRIVQQANWERPIYFAVTVPISNMAGLKANLSMEGMAYRLVKEQTPNQFDVKKVSNNLLKIYQFTSVSDSTVYKDPVARRLLGNYLVLFEGLVQSYLKQGLYKKAFQTLQEAEKRVPPYAIDTPETWGILGRHYREIAIKLNEAGELDLALAALDELLRIGPKIKDRENLEAVIRSQKNKGKTVNP